MRRPILLVSRILPGVSYSNRTVSVHRYSVSSPRRNQAESNDNTSPPPDPADDQTAAEEDTFTSHGEKKRGAGRVKKREREESPRPKLSKTTTPARFGEDYGNLTRESETETRSRGRAQDNGSLRGERGEDSAEKKFWNRPVEVEADGSHKKRFWSDKNNARDQDGEN